jgi:predicted enzyme related to lactoylglutathione lyase
MFARSVVVGVIAVLAACASLASAAPEPGPDVSVGPQYDATHVYVSPADLDAFVASFTATFGGTASKPLVTNVLPVPSSATFRYVMTPSGTLSVFAFTTPVPFPFGAERTGYLVTDLDAAVAAARASGAEVVVEPFKDPIGRDAVVRWPGGFETQLYWHFVTPVYAPLSTTPDNRVYVSRDRADELVRDFLAFSHGRVVSDEPQADAGEIGRPGGVYRRVRIESGFGRMQVMITDGHLPYPFGRELTGYQVGDLAAAIARAVAAGAKVLSPPYDAGDRMTAVLQFPGGYIAEAHALNVR